MSDSRALVPFGSLMDAGNNSTPPLRGVPQQLLTYDPIRSDARDLVVAGERRDGGTNSDIPLRGRRSAPGNMGGFTIIPDRRPDAEDEPFGGTMPPIRLNPAKPRESTSMHDWVSTGAGTYFVAEGVKSGLEMLLAPAYDVENERGRLLARMTSPQADAAILAARQAQTNTRGTSVGGNLEVYRTLLSLTQDPDEARSLLGAFLPTGVALQHFNPKGGDYAHQLESVMKSAEFEGMVSHIDPKTGRAVADADAARKLGEMLLRMDVLSKGAIEPSTFLRFLRSGGTAAATMSLDDVPFMLPLLQAMTPSQAGNALKGFNQQFGAGRMSGAAVDDLIHAGIITGGGDYKTNRHVHKAGMGIYRLDPDAMSPNDMVQILVHPKDFIHDTLLPHVGSGLHGFRGKTFDTADPKARIAMEAEELQRLASRIPGGTFMGELIRNFGLMVRDGGADKALQGKDLIKPLMANPSVANDMFTGSLNHLMGILGDAPLKHSIDMLNGLSSALNALNRAADTHPVAAKQVGAAAGDAATYGGLAALLGLAGGGASKLGLAGAGKVLGGTARMMMGRLGLSLLRGQLVHDLDSGDQSGQWIDKHIPGAAAVDDFFYRVTGGRVGWKEETPGFNGQPMNQTTPLKVQLRGPAAVTVTNTHDIATATTANVARQLTATPSSGATVQPLSTPQFPGRVNHWKLRGRTPHKI